MNSQRIVVKVGSALIAPDKQGCSSRYLLAIAQFIQRCRLRGIDVVLVSSGSVAAGRHLFSASDQNDITLKKAMAAAGQNEMMATWDRFFDFKTAQVLLTHADLRNRDRYQSIRDTLFALLENGILPIVNENDAVTTDHLRVGDNDNLSAMVATAADADTLIMCTDVDGLFNKNPAQHQDAQLLKNVPRINSDIYAMAGGAVSSVGTGGMRTKVEAAEKATSHGITTYIVNGQLDSTFAALLAGENPGTCFSPYEKPMQEELHWLAHTTRALGEVVIRDAGDEDFTASNVLAVKGEFSAGDTILVRNDEGEKLAKARSRYSSCLLNFIAGQSHRINALGFDEPIVQQDCMMALN